MSPSRPRREPSPPASLRNRIIVAESRGRSSVIRPSPAPRSFAEQYRGTEYEAAATQVPDGPPVARGRVFVLLSLSVVIVTSALILGSVTL